MQQVTKRSSGQEVRRPAHALGTDELGVIVGALYDISHRARRATPGDPVEPAGLRVLVAVQTSGSPRPSEVAQALQLDLSVVSRHVSSLVNDGQLLITPDPDDRRAHHISLTAKGEETIRTVVDNRRSAVGKVLASWPADDKARLTDLLRQLADDLAELNR
jgi:DNA-binding MarR family transcriptional regulator